MAFSSKLASDQEKVFTFNLIDPELLKFDPQTTLDPLQSISENVTGENRLGKTYVLNMTNNNYYKLKVLYR